jgi:hypothetical protein
MRITISIDDELHRSAKARARARGKTLGALMEDALRRELAADDTPAERPQIPIFRGGNGPRPGVDLTSNRSLYELLDEGLPVEKLR